MASAVDHMLNALREAAREAREEKESAEAYYAVLDDAFTAIAAHRDPNTVVTRLKAQALATQRALSLIQREVPK